MALGDSRLRGNDGKWLNGFSRVVTLIGIFSSANFEEKLAFLRCYKVVVLNESPHDNWRKQDAGL